MRNYYLDTDNTETLFKKLKILPINKLSTCSFVNRNSCIDLISRELGSNHRSFSPIGPPWTRQLSVCGGGMVIVAFISHKPVYNLLPKKNNNNNNKKKKKKSRAMVKTDVGQRYQFM